MHDAIIFSYFTIFHRILSFNVLILHFAACTYKSIKCEEIITNHRNSLNFPCTFDSYSELKASLQIYFSNSNTFPIFIKIKINK